MTVERRRAGLSLIELTLAIAILALLVAGLGNVTLTALEASDHGRARNASARDAQFAMQRILAATARAPGLLIPQVDGTATMINESVRQPGVLGLRLDPTLDRNRDGFVDVDNDHDGRVDEDWPRDISNDGRPGLRDLDDNNDGQVDFAIAGVGDDDDKTIGLADEDPIDGVDNERDGSIDEDPPADMNGDGAAGIALVDDDGDGSIDEGAASDDDEDGVSDEDWVDAVAFFLQGTNLRERMPTLDPASGSSYVERTIAENVTLFRVERLPRGSRRFELLDLTLEIGAGDAAIQIRTRARIGH